MSVIKVHDKFFKPYIAKAQLEQRIAEMAANIDRDYVGKKPLFIAILNGSFVFAAELFTRLTIEAEISFVKLASYHGTSSTGDVITAIGLDENINGRHIIILEDIIDTGKTLHSFLPQIRQASPASLELTALLLKPDALQFPLDCMYSGFEIPNDFVLGFGLDYDGLGRNLPELYTLVKD